MLLKHLAAYYLNEKAPYMFIITAILVFTLMV